MNIAEEQIEAVFEKVHQCKFAYAEAAEVLVDAKKELEIAKLEGLASGAIEGKNAELREAAARELLPNAYIYLETAEKREREAKFDLDTAYLDYDCLKMLMRLAELQDKRE